MSFESDKRFGEEGAVALVRYLSRFGFASEFAEGNFPGWDVHVHAATIEVKRDRQTSVTGNVFVEVSSHGNPSGISITKADTWAFIGQDSGLIIGTAKLRAILADFPEVAARDGKRGRIIPVRFLSALPFVGKMDLRELLP